MVVSIITLVIKALRPYVSAEELIEADCWEQLKKAMKLETRGDFQQATDAYKAVAEGFATTEAGREAVIALRVLRDKSSRPV